MPEVSPLPGGAGTQRASPPRARSIMHLCWGHNSFQQLGVEAEPGAGAGAGALRCRAGADLRGGRLVQAACGERHSLLLLADGSVWSCGSNGRGQLGRKSRPNCERPARIHALETQTIVFVGCGKEHSLAVSREGSVFSWGSGSEGQLGTEKFKDFCIPKKIVGLSGVKIIQVSCGHHHSIALAQDSRVFSWGNDNDGQLGLGKKVPPQASPQRVKSLDGIPLAQVAAGRAHSFALSLSGTLYGWGSNNMGQLALKGRNAAVKQCCIPTLIDKLKDLHVTYVSCGDDHTAVLTQEGKVFTFGRNNSGQLGHTFENNGPHIVNSANSIFSQVACGSSHTLAYECTTRQVVSFGRGSQEHLKSSSQPGHSVQNFNISKLISSHDFTNIQVKEIFAGGNANFVTTIESKDISSSCTIGRSLEQISQINQALINKWTTVEIGSEEYEASKREICEVFSFPACLTASFLEKRTERSIPIPVDLQKARDVFRELTRKNWISHRITECLRVLLMALTLDSPHEEALSIFLLLPECPVMHTPENWKSLVVPFAKAFCKLNDSSSEILEKWWASLEESSFISLIQTLKRTIYSQLMSWSKTDPVQCNTETLLKMLKKLHEVNKKANCKVPESTFHISELLNQFNFFEDIGRWHFLKKQSISSSDTNIPATFLLFPFVFNFHSKIKILEANSFFNCLAANLEMLPLFQNQEIESCNHFQVRRSHLVRDTLNQLSQVEENVLKLQPSFTFIGEIDQHAGGVTKEFFSCVFEKMIHPDYGMFLYFEETSLIWFPSRPKFPKKDYFLFGILCGLSVINSNAVNLPFPLALFKKLLDQKPSLEDLQELKPELGRNLQSLLKTDNVEELEIYFSIHWDKKDVNLIQKKSPRRVDQTNKYIDYIFNKSVKKIYEAFQMGFYKVCEKEIINLFNPEELKDVMTGNPDFDWEIFEKNSKYGQGYNKLHPTIRMFWKVFHKLSLEKKKKFIIFLTGNDRIQVHKVNTLAITFSCSEPSREEELPTAWTCSHILNLPRYSTLERMEEALEMVIKNYRGFGL